MNILNQLAPEMDPQLIQRLVAAFQDLRVSYETGVLNYPYSLRGKRLFDQKWWYWVLIWVLELINLVRHMGAYPNDTLGEALRNIFDFDIYKPETMEVLSALLIKHGYVSFPLTLNSNSVILLQFRGIELGFGCCPWNCQEGQRRGIRANEQDFRWTKGRETWRQGTLWRWYVCWWCRSSIHWSQKDEMLTCLFQTGGRSTAGMGGMGGYKRFYKGGDIKQVHLCLGIC